MIDYDSPVPAYRQIAGVLRGEIESGERAPGSRLPSITTLMQEYGVARVTASKALRLLVTEGLAEMSTGMGTYVKRPG